MVCCRSDISCWVLQRSAVVASAVCSAIAKCEVSVFNSEASGPSAAGLFDWVIVARGLELFEWRQGTVDHEGEIERVIQPAR